jgi:choline dehydrogenase
MVYLRSGVSDFEDWQVPSWRWAELLGEYEALERVLDPHRREPTGFTEACIAAAEHAGFRRKEDLNDGDLDGVLGYEWMNYRGDERRSSYVAFLRPALDRPNLRVETGAQVRRVLFDVDRKVEGIEYVQRGVVRRANAKREVVLCGGAVETTKLMLLSGIGAASQLRKHGISVLLEQPRVGQNFQDHPNVTLFYQGGREMDAKYPQLYGFARANPSSKLRPQQPDTCYVFYPARSSLREMMMRMLPTMLVPAAVRERSPLPEQGIRSAVALAFQSQQLRNFVAKLYGTVVILGKPKSRGTVELGGAKVSDPARIDPAYFTDPEDLQTMIEGVKLARRITGAPALREWGARELFPGRWAATSRLIEGFIRANAMTTFHFAGTCSMGTDERSVVDERLRVRGIAGLRIADASVMPVVPVSALNAPSMLIGHRAASFMLAEA